MIRTGWFLLNLLIWTTFFATVAIGAGLLGVKPKPRGVYDWCAGGWSRKMLWAAGVRPTLVGGERVPTDTPVVYVSNHQSWFDIWVLFSLLPGQVRFVAKKELRRTPLLGRAMYAARHIFIDRGNRQAAFAAYDEAARTIGEGLSPVVFAEGTRSRTGQLQPFKKGPFVLAIAAQVPVVPVYCAGTFTLLPKGSVRIRPHPVTVYVGEPIATAGMTYEDRTALMEAAWDAVARLRVDATAGRD